MRSPETPSSTQGAAVGSASPSWKRSPPPSSTSRRIRRRVHPSAPNLRGWLLRRYPYTLIYREEAELIYVLAIAPHRKRPGYWRERV